jgi:hypothetical protein
MLIRSTKRDKLTGLVVIGCCINFLLLLSTKQPTKGKHQSIFKLNITNHYKKGNNNGIAPTFLTGIAHFGSSPLPF